MSTPSSPTASPTARSSLPSSPRHNLKAIRTPELGALPTADTPTKSDIKRDIITDRDAMDGLHPVELYAPTRPFSVGNDPVAIDTKPPLPPPQPYPPPLAKGYVHTQAQSVSSVSPVSPAGDAPPYYPALEKAIETPAATPQETRIFGIRRTTALLILSNILLLIILIIVSAVQGSQLRAVSSALTSSGSMNSAQGSTEPLSIPAAFNGTGPHVDDQKNVCLGTTPLPKGFGVARPECPGSNGTMFVLPGTNLMFQRRCDMDLPNNDIAHVPMTDFKDCLALCAFINLGQNIQGSQCAGVTWVFGDGPQGTGVNHCYPKSRADNLSARAGAESAVLVD